MVTFPYANSGTIYPGSGYTEGADNLNNLSPSQLVAMFQSTLSYSLNGDPMDFNSQMDLINLTVLISQNWNSLSSAQQSTVKDYLNMNITFNGKTESVGTMIANSILTAAAGVYVQNNGTGGDPDDATASWAVTLYYDLDNNNSSGLLTGMMAALDPLTNSLNVDSWAHSTGVYNGQSLSVITNFSQFVWDASVDWANDFTMNGSNSSSVIDQMNEIQINQYVTECTDGNGQVNAAELLILLMYLMSGPQSNDVQNQITGRGNMMNTMAAPLGSLTQGLMSAWSGGNFTGTSAQNFYNDITQLQQFSQDPRFASSITPAIQQLLNDVGPSSTISVTFDMQIQDGSNGTQTAQVTTTLGQLYHMVSMGTTNGTSYSLSPGPNNYVSAATWTTGPDAGTNVEEYHVFSWDDMSSGLNSLAPVTTAGSSTTAPGATPTGYSTISNDLSNITNVISNTSSAQGTLLSNLTAFEQQLNAFISALGSYDVDASKFAVQAMQSAGS